MENHQSALCGKDEGFSSPLERWPLTASFEMAAEILNNMRKNPKTKGLLPVPRAFQNVDSLCENAVNTLESFEYTTFLVGVELPTVVEEREDEFKARFEVGYGESMRRNEFSREIGKKIAEKTNNGLPSKNLMLWR
jgi:tRNA U54 and U55 pseudouridine synthase Pus10